jgi:hypothetical protein
MTFILLKSLRVRELSEQKDVIALNFYQGCKEENSLSRIGDLCWKWQGGEGGEECHTTCGSHIIDSYSVG